VAPAIGHAQSPDVPAPSASAELPAQESVAAEATAKTDAEPIAVTAPADAVAPSEAASTDLTPLAASADTSVVVIGEPEKPKDTLTVDFPDEEVRNILRNVADLFELNLVVPDTLQGRTSIKLSNVTWRQIFKVVLTPVGYTFIEDANIIKVVTIDSLAQEPLSTEVFVLNFARAEEIEPSIKPLVDSATGGRVLVDKRINALIISERPSRMEKITPVLESLDKATEQVMIESKFIEITDTNTRDLGLRWSTSGGVTAGAGERAVGAGSNATNYTTLGAGAAPAATSIAPGYSYSTAVLSNFELAATLEALESKTDSRIVSNPTIVTLNNTQAEINVGEEYPIPSYTYNAEQGNFEISGFEYKPIGVLLKVTPQVNAQGFIRLNLEPEISDFDPARSVNFGGASGADIPIINTKKTKTQVSMKDGHTLAIGGLMSGGDSTTVNKVPILGDLPGIGRLFQSKSKDKSNTNLLIFITAKLVNAESAQVREIFSAEQVHAAGLKRSDLPGIRRSDDEGFFAPEKLPAPSGKTP
jgi:type IV pilus assembly protein PilQ